MKQVPSAVFVALTVALAIQGDVRAQTPLGATFTYQGQLKNGGSPANGAFHMVFRLFDAATGGNQVGPTLKFDGAGGNPPPIAVANGLFTVGLDFGSTAFDGNSRWLDITVGIATLTPRQELTAAPYARFSAAPWATSGSDVSYTSGNVGIGNGKLLGYSPSDSFSYDGKTMGHYTAGWFNDSWNPFGSTAWLSGYAGLKFFSNGGLSMAIDQGGNVGIGTTTPGMVLDVRPADIIGNSTVVGADQHDAANRGTKVSFGHQPAGTSEFVGMRTLIDQGTNFCGNTADIQFDTWECETSVSREVMRINGRGNVGIGTPTPGAQLDVIGNGALPHVRIASRDDSSTPYGAFLSLDATPTSGGKNWLLFSTGAFAGEGQGKLVFQNNTDNVSAMAFDSAGNVGIGTVSPARKLTVAADSAAGPDARQLLIQGASDGNRQLLIGYQTTGDYGSIQSVHQGTAFTPLALQPGGGNVGVGTVSPGCSLEVNGGIRARGGPPGAFGGNNNGYAFGSPGDEDGGIFSSANGQIEFYTNSVEKMRINGSGNVGIGTTAPGVRLDVVASGDAIHGTANGGSETNGVYGVSNVSNGTGVLGECNSGSLAYGVWGRSSSGYAGVFDGRVQVNGTLSKSAGSFKIDHPLDPENKYLSHSFVESPDMKNVYDGIAVLDATGQAMVQLPDWFSALNKDFRYQLTAIGAPAPNLYIAQEVADNRFVIAGGRAALKVSWQVTGIRHDAYADAHRIPVEEDKATSERGRYLHPDLFGKAPEFSIAKRPPSAEFVGKSAQ